METVSLFGFEFWNASGEEEVVQWLTGRKAKELFVKDNINFLITPNAYDIVQYFTKYTSIYRFFKGSGVVLADGMPIVWLSRLRKREKPLKQRITGSDLFPVLWDTIKRGGRKAFFILPNHTIGQRLQAEYPNIQYIVPDQFDQDGVTYINRFLDEHIATIKAFQPEYLFIGITLPKQQKIAMRLHHLLSGKVSFNCLIAILGASFEYHVGLKKRAPRILQKSGFEWLYRFIREPKRTWKRYTFGNLAFLRIAFREIFSKTGTRKVKAHEKTTTDTIPWIGEKLISEKKFN